ncbi:MAG: response regulator [Ktedonobacteraceae bacterium]
MQYTSIGNVATIIESKNMSATIAPESPYALVVDDDEAILSVVMLLLETEGHVGLGFSDSSKVIPFLEQLETKHLPHVILLDLMMPLVSGYEIAATLSQHPRFASIPIIIMTADNRVKSASAVPGATDWVGKPFQMHYLLTKLEHFLYPPTT